MRIFLRMGLVQSFKSSYDSNMSKKRKPKRKPFSSFNGSQGALGFDSDQLVVSSETLQEIAREALADEKESRTRQILVILLTLTSISALVFTLID